MDSKMFRLATKPNFYRPSQPVDIRTVAVNQNLPAPDSRFPGWPAPMEDARLVTNYQPHCESNIPAGKQYPTVRWMQRNADKIIEMDRTVIAKRMGAGFPLDPTVVPPPTSVVKCSKSVCSRSETEFTNGIGTERLEGVPELFGTYMISQTVPVQGNIAYTGKYEGGRNSLRGALATV
jgi:hypothetical protein